MQAIKPIRVPSVKPKLRGVFHEIAFYVSLITGPILILVANAGARMEALIYSASLSSMFGASALYHRPNWRPNIRAWWRKLDHAMIFVFIAGTFTPIALGLKGDPWARTLLATIWIMAAAGMLMQLLPWRPPKYVIIIPYLAMGWAGPFIIPAAYKEQGFLFLTLLTMGGLLYTAGAVAYAKHKPNIKPGVFGYHEFFHVFVVAAAVCHYVAVTMIVS